MAQQDLIKIHNVKEIEQQIAPHTDLVGMLQLVRDKRLITVINKRTQDQNPELIELLLFQKDELDDESIYALVKENGTIEPYILRAPTADSGPLLPVAQVRNAGAGIIVTKSSFTQEEDPRGWSAKYHFELDRSVVRQTNNPAPQENAVIIEHTVEGITQQTPVNFRIEPLIRGNEIIYYKAGSGDFIVLLQSNLERYYIKQENVRSSGAQDNRDFYIPVLKARKDIPSKDSDEPSIVLDYDPDSQASTKIALTERIKTAVNESVRNIIPAFSLDLSDRRREVLKLRLTIPRFDAPDLVQDAELVLPSLITDWGEIEGSLSEQLDLAAALDRKANKIMQTDTNPIGTAPVGTQLGLVEFNPYYQPGIPPQDEIMSFADGSKFGITAAGLVNYYKPPVNTKLRNMAVSYDLDALEIDPSFIFYLPVQEQTYKFENLDLIARIDGKVISRTVSEALFDTKVSGDYIGVIDFPNQLTPTPPAQDERMDFFNGSFLTAKADGTITFTDVQAVEHLLFDGASWRADTLNVNNVITVMPLSMTSEMWTGSTVINTIDTEVYDGTAWTAASIPAGHIIDIPPSPVALWDALSHTYTEVKTCYDGANWVETDLQLGAVAAQPAAAVSDIWNATTYDTVIGQVIDLPDIPPMIDQKLSDHDADQTSHPYLLNKIDTDLADHDADGAAHPAVQQKITADIDTHDASVSSHPHLLNKIDADLAAHNTADSAHADIRQKVSDDIASHNSNAAAHPSIILWADSEIDEAVGAHNGSSLSHPDIRNNITAAVNAHNDDTAEDQHPLIRAAIAAAVDTHGTSPQAHTDIARMPPLPSADGQYKLVISGGTASWEAV